MKHDPSLAKINDFSSVAKQSDLIDVVAYMGAKSLKSFTSFISPARTKLNPDFAENNAPKARRTTIGKIRTAKKVAISIDGEAKPVSQLAEETKQKNPLEEIFSNDKTLVMGEIKINGLTLKNAEGRIQSGDQTKKIKSSQTAPEIIQAAENGDLELLKSLVKKGVGINTRNSRGWTALHIATDQDNLKMMDYLIKNGANVNEPVKMYDWDKFGYTPLHIAAVKGNINSVVKLVNVGKADMNVLTLPSNYSDGKHIAPSTALELAKMKNHQGVTRFLERKMNSPKNNPDKPSSKKFQDNQKEKDAGVRRS